MRVCSILLILSASLLRADFIVSVSNSNGTVGQIQRYSDSGAFVGTMVNGGGGLNTPEGIAYGPDGNLYVADFANGTINRYDGQTGAFLNTFASNAALVQSVIGIGFGPNGNLYTSDYNGSASAVSEFNGTTGALIASFNIPAGSGGLSGPLDIAFNGVGNLLVSSSNTNQVLRYDANTGAFLGVAVAAGAGGLNFPDGIALDTVHNVLYVSSSFSDQVLKYDAATGTSLGTFATLPKGASPIGVMMQPNGNLLVAGNASQTVYQYDSTGTLLGTIGHSQLTAVNGFPTYLAEVPSLNQAPEPSTAVLFIAGAFLVWSRRKRSSSTAKCGSIASMR